MLVSLAACSTGTPRNAPIQRTADRATDPHAKPPCCAAPDREAPAKTAPPTARVAAKDLTIPDLVLIDQNRKPVRFFTELVQGKTVAISYFFTSCTTICPPLTATMAQVQRRLKQDGRDDIQLISISVDPVTDTPERLNAWSKNFNAQPGWSFLTGEKRTVDKLLKALNAFTPDPQDHSPMILVGNQPAGVWRQVYGLASATDVHRAIIDLAGPKPTPAKPDPTRVATPVADVPAVGEHPAAADRRDHEAARAYFSDVELVDQHGRTHRFYTDLMQDRVIVINSFFSSCTGVCPVLNKKLIAIRDAFSDHVGKDLFLLSITVDPTVDTPSRLADYASGIRAGDGWYFLTGTRDNVEAALAKLGMNVDYRENHSNLLLIGNERTGLWKKAFGLAADEELAAIVDSVLNDDTAQPN